MKINNQSDFKIKGVTKNEDFNVRFRFEFFVYEFKKYVVSWDGKEYVNCKRLDDGSLEIIFNNPKFGLGQLKVRREYYISDEDFIDGIWNAVTVEKTGIYITDGETDDIDVENVIVPPYIKGEPGKDMKWSTMTQDEKDELINDLGEGINNSFVEAETTRNNNEELRKTSESARVTAEQGRVEAELKRGTDFDTLKSEMQTAIDEGKAATKETIAATEGLDAIVEEQNAKLTELGYEVFPFQMYANTYIDDIGNINHINDTWYCSGYIAVKGLIIESIKIRVNSNTSTASYIAFYDADFEFIEGYNGSFSTPLEGSYSIIEMPNIPTNAEYVAFCSIRKPMSVKAYYNVVNGTHPLQKMLPINPMLLNEKKRAMDSERANLEYSKNMEHLSIISGQYINQDGKVLPNNGWNATPMVSLDKIVFKSIYLKTNGKSSLASYIAFYDNNFNYVGGYNGSISEDDNYIKSMPSIPNEAVYVKFCAYRDYPKVYALYSGVSFVSVFGNSLDLYQYKTENDKVVNELKMKANVKLHVQSYIDPNGVFMDEDSPSIWFRTGYFHLLALNVKSIKIRVNSNTSTASYIAFYDADFKFISNIDGTKADSDLYIKTIGEIPSNAVYVAFCSIKEPLRIDADYNGLDLSNAEYVKEKSKLTPQIYDKIAERAVYIGDSISSTNPLYGGKPVGVLLQEWGIITNVEVLAVSGSKILGAIDQITSAKTENPDIVFVATGVNDWAANVNGLGEWFSETTDENGDVIRTYDVSSNTIRARYNKLYQAVRSKYPLARIIFSTVIKKANNSRQADYGYVYSPSYLEKNKESGLWLDEMRSTVLDMPRICQVEAMDMWSLCGLDPTIESHLNRYFYDKTHPNAEGHKLMAEAMYKYLKSN